MKTIKEYLQEQLYQDLSFNYNNINESGGLYDGQIELSTYIVNKIINTNTDKYIFNSNELKFKNIFFNKLYIYVKYYNAINHNNNITCSIDIYSNDNKWDEFKKYNYDKNNNRLDIISIELKCPEQVKDYYDNIRSRISHELNHAYTYWQILKDDFNEINIVPDDYHNKLHKWTDKIYNKISTNIVNPLNSDAEQICYNLIYTLTRYERNAFLSEIVTYLYDNKSIFKDINNIKNYLNSSKQYKLYTEEGPKIIDIIKNKWSNDKKQLLSITYNKIYNTNYSINKVIKLLEFKIEETIKKINKNIVTLSKKYINENNQEDIHFIYFPNEIELF